MTTRQVNVAVDVFRKLVKLERKLDLIRFELDRKVEALNDDGDFGLYMRLTQEIEVAADQAVAEAEERGLSDSTIEQRFAVAVNGAGLSRRS